MNYYKILNIRKVDTTRYDYKTLDTSKVKPFSAIYPYDVSKDNYCILISTENIEHEDLIKLTEEEYLQLKEQILSEYPESEENLINTLGQELAQLKIQLIMGGII